MRIFRDVQQTIVAERNELKVAYRSFLQKLKKGTSAERLFAFPMFQEKNQCQNICRAFGAEKKGTSAERLFAFPIFQDYRPISSAEYLFGFPIFQVAFQSFKMRQLNFCSGTCYLYPTGAGSIPVFGNVEKSVKPHTSFWTPWQGDDGSPSDCNVFFPRLRL